MLDFGVRKKDGYDVGGGYATIAIPPGQPCTVEHTHFQPLQRAVPWEEDDGDLRKILLSWNAVPDFCRVCGSSDYCCADCPDHQSWLKCFNCHQTGHEWKHCPRKNDATGTEAPSKTRAVPTETKKLSRKTPLKVKNSIVDKPTLPPPRVQETPVADAATPTQPNPASTRVTNTGEKIDSKMDEADQTLTKPNKNRSNSPEPQDTKKVAKTNDSTDVPDSRKKQRTGQLSATAATTHSNNNGLMNNDGNIHNGGEHPDVPKGSDPLPSPNHQ